MCYTHDLDEVFGAIERATWLTTDQYTEYVQSFHEYERDRNECLSALITLIGLPDEDILSNWAQTRGPGALALTQFGNDTRLSNDSNENTENRGLGMQEWANRQMCLYESLRAERFLQARQYVISIRRTILLATESVDSYWGIFDRANQAANAGLTQGWNSYREQIANWGEVVGNAADAASKIIGGQSGASGTLGTVLTFIENAAKIAPTLEAVYSGREAKKAAWEILKKLSEFNQGMILNQIDHDSIERQLDEARFDDVSGSEDFNAFRANAITAFGVHLNAALDASAAYFELANRTFEDRSSSALENITLLDETANRLKEFKDMLKSIRDALNCTRAEINRLREGPERDAATENLNTAEGTMARIEEDQQRTCDEFGEEATHVIEP